MLKYGSLFGNTSDLVDTLMTSHLYSGEQTDALTGMQYLRARYYDPTTGRFNRVDPFAGNTQDPQSLHKYAYANPNTSRINFRFSSSGTLTDAEHSLT